MPPSNPKLRVGLSASDIASVPLSALAPLTPRQAEILGWIAAGKRNREIAKMLECSVRTVGKHIENIKQALGGGTRNAIGAWWHQRRLELAQESARNGA
jgi:DNA-binding CsgD family transcriptional regulator